MNETGKIASPCPVTNDSSSRSFNPINLLKLTEAKGECCLFATAFGTRPLSISAVDLPNKNRQGRIWERLLEFLGQVVNLWAVTCPSNFDVQPDFDTPAVSDAF